MVNWFSRSKKRTEVPRLRPRSNASAATRVDLAELTPEPLRFLGQAAYLELTMFENLSAAVATAPTTDAKERLSRAAALTLTRHHGLTAEIERHGHVVSEAMEPFTSAIDNFQRVTQGADWYEALTSCHIVAGFLDDFFVRLAAGLPADYVNRVLPVLTAESGQSVVAEEIRLGIDANPRLAPRLAMWGRRLVGDTMLVARSALAPSANQASDDARIDPVFSDLIAAHTRRMDALGLTA